MKFPNSRLIAVFGVFASIYVFSSVFAPYPFSPVVKVFPIIILFFWAWSNLSGKTKLFGLLALACSGLGDVLLALQFDNNFIAGLPAFLVAHVFYLALFISFINLQKRNLKIGIGLGVTAFSILVALLVLPEEFVLRLAMIIYTSVITLMCWLALLSARGHCWLHASGAVVFAISDSIIAWDAFREPIPNASIGIMATYYLAQLLIMIGIFRLMATSRHENSHKADTNVHESV